MKNFQSVNVHRINRAGKLRRIVGVFALFLFVFLLFIFNRSIAGSFLRFFGVGMWEVQTESEAVIGQTANMVLRSKSSLIKENTELREERNLYSTLALENKFLKEENQSLKEQLGRTNYSLKRVTASILSRPPQSPYDTLVLDAGASEGVKDGDLIALGSVVLGKIVAVDNHSSLATMFSSPKQELQALIASSSVQSTVYGRGGGNYFMRLPADVDVDEGDIISLPSMNPRILGSVARVEEASADSFKMVFFRTPINIEQLRWVDILIP